MANTNSREVKLAKQRKRARKWRERNREKLREYFRRYCANNQRLIAYHRAYYQKHKDGWNKARTPAQKARQRELDTANRDYINARRRERRSKNVALARERERQQRLRHPEKKREQDRRYRSRYPEKYRASVLNARAKKPDLYRLISRASVQARRSRKRLAIVERVSIKRIFARDQMHNHVKVNDASLDHLIPVVRLGAYAEWNLMVAHLSCNQRRNTKQILPDETKAAASAYMAECHAKLVNTKEAA
jgi:hypothetical protein